MFLFFGQPYIFWGYWLLNATYLFNQPNIFRPTLYFLGYWLQKTFYLINLIYPYILSFKILLSHPKAKGLLDVSDRYDNTPLHMAAQNGYISILRVKTPATSLKFSSRNAQKQRFTYIFKPISMCPASIISDFLVPSNLDKINLSYLSSKCLLVITWYPEMTTD